MSLWGAFANNHNVTPTATQTKTPPQNHVCGGVKIIQATVYKNRPKIAATIPPKIMVMGRVMTHAMNIW